MGLEETQQYLLITFQRHKFRFYVISEVTKYLFLDMNTITKERNIILREQNRNFGARSTKCYINESYRVRKKAIARERNTFVRERNSNVNKLLRRNKIALRGNKKHLKKVKEILICGCQKV